MDGENDGKPYEKLDDLGVPLFLETPSYNYIPRDPIPHLLRMVSWNLNTLLFGGDGIHPIIISEGEPGSLGIVISKVYWDVLLELSNYLVSWAVT